MKLIADEYPLLGCNMTKEENFKEVYALAEKFVGIVLAEGKSYAEACKAFDIAKEGLTTLPLSH